MKEKTPEEQIKELESKLSAVSKENETYKKILDKEQQLKESINFFGQRPAEIIDDHEFSPKCDEATENPPEKGLYISNRLWNYSMYFLFT